MTAKISSEWITGPARQMLQQRWKLYKYISAYTGKDRVFFRNRDVQFLLFSFSDKLFVDISNRSFWIMA